MEDNMQYDEISLKELIGNLLKNKVMIISITLILGILAFSVSKFYITPVYESESTLMANFISSTNTVGAGNFNSAGEILSNYSIYPVMTIESYTSQILSSEVLLSVIDKMDLNKEYNYEQFRSKVTVSIIDKSNLIKIKVTDKDPERAALIANNIADEFSIHISYIQNLQIAKSTEVLSAQLTLEKVKLDNALLELKDFQAQIRGVDTITQEINLKTSSLGSFKKELNDLNSNYEEQNFSFEKDIELSNEKIDKYNEIIKNTKVVFTLDENIFNSSLNSALGQEVTNSLQEQVDLSVKSEKLNPVYLSNLQVLADEKIKLISLESSLSKLIDMYEYKNVKLAEDISKIEKDLEVLRVEYAEADYEQKMIMQKVTTAENTYKAFNNKLEASRVAEAAKVADTSIISISNAIKPNNPVSPNVMLNTAIGFVLGLMLSVFIALFKEYWKNAK